METNLMINILITIGFVAVLACLNSLLSYLLEFCFYEHSIFGSYLPWLAKWNLKYFKPKIYNELQLTKDLEGQDNRLIDAAVNLPFFKMLGGCIVCFNIWLGMITFTGLHIGLNLSFWYAFPYILFSSFILRKIIK